MATVMEEASRPHWNPNQATPIEPPSPQPQPSPPARASLPPWAMVTIAVLGTIVAQNFLRAPQPPPVPGPAPVPGVTLADAVAAVGLSREDGQLLAALAREYARLIEVDGTREVPLIVDTYQLGQRFHVMLQYGLTESLADKYPALNDVIGRAVEQRIDTGSEPVLLTPQLRQTAIGLWQEIAEGASR